uniref:Uncharacterized protein n=1 Tax=Octopus bimaculoides TaxID=37653 RepID=A0A0L8HF71_OCTBM
MLRHEVRFTHKDYGKQGSEFIIEHPQIHLFRMLYSTPFLTFAAYLVNLSEWVKIVFDFYVGRIRLSRVLLQCNH